MRVPIVDMVYIYISISIFKLCVLFATPFKITSLSCSFYAYSSVLELHYQLTTLLLPPLHPGVSRVTQQKDMTNKQTKTYLQVFTPNSQNKSDEHEGKMIRIFPMSSIIITTLFWSEAKHELQQVLIYSLSGSVITWSAQFVLKIHSFRWSCAQSSPNVHTNFTSTGAARITPNKADYFSNFVLVARISL